MSSTVGPDPAVHTATSSIIIRCQSPGSPVFARRRGWKNNAAACRSTTLGATSDAAAK
ncbi:MAG TPA: hypothetical protein VK807_04035 [Gemmatimonadaceae bacterium]|nr:hypothetical protein [Gemmatimonadaceae bacterium]